MNRLRSEVSRVSLALVCLLALSVPGVAADWSDEATVYYRDEPVVVFRATFEEGQLIVQAAHSKGWHTYALDNVERARERSGMAEPETEMPMRFDGGGALRIVGPWLQSPPLDLSTPELRWYTWGFERTALFAAGVKWVGGSHAVLTINGQACTAEICARIDDLVIELPLTPADLGRMPTLDLSGLIEVSPGS